MTVRQSIRSLAVVLLLTGTAFPALAEKAEIPGGLIHEAEFQRLWDQNGDRWIEEDKEIQAKLAELETKFGKKLEAATLTQKELEATIFELMVSNNFAKSAFVKDKLAMTPRVDEAYFKDNFKVEKGDDGKYHVIAYNKGEKLFSEERVGEPPEFDEAVALMVARDPDRDSLIIAPGEGGSGNHGSEHRADGVRNANQNPFVKGPYFNLTTQGEIHRTDPQRATRLMAEAKIANANNAK